MFDLLEVASKFQKYIKEAKKEFYMPNEIGMRFADTDVPGLSTYWCRLDLESYNDSLIRFAVEKNPYYRSILVLFFLSFNGSPRFVAVTVSYRTW